MKAPILTSAHLKGACPKQVALFQRTFPKGAPLTAASLTKAQAAGLDVLWAVALLDAPAVPEYWRIADLAWAEYRRVSGPALAEYQRVNGPALLAALRATFRRAAKATL